MIKNIIFDWGGVLSNDFQLVYSGAMYVFRKLGLRILSADEFKREFILPYMDFYEKFTTAPKEEIDRLFFQAIHLLEKPTPFQGVKELLEFLNRKKIMLAILSSNPQGKLEEEVKDYGLEEFFVDIVGGVHDKTEEIFRLMERNSFLPHETAYVGDMIHDIEAGKKAKTTTIAASWGGFQTREELDAEQPDFLIDDLRKIKEIISRVAPKESLFYFNSTEQALISFLDISCRQSFKKSKNSFLEKLFWIFQWSSTKFLFSFFESNFQVYFIFSS